jgi:hypothetical protein
MELGAPSAPAGSSHLHDNVDHDLIFYSPKLAPARVPSQLGGSLVCRALLSSCLKDFRPLYFVANLHEAVRITFKPQIYDVPVDYKRVQVFRSESDRKAQQEECECVVRDTCFKVCSIVQCSVGQEERQRYWAGYCFQN